MRPGWKTTEFWLALLGNLAAIAGVALQVVPPGPGAAVLGGISAAYTIGRAITKANAPEPDQVGPAIQQAAQAITAAIGSKTTESDQPVTAGGAKVF